MKRIKLKGSIITSLWNFQKDLNHLIDVKLYPFKRVLVIIEKGFCDGGFSLFQTKEKEKYALFSSFPMHKSIYKIFVKKGNTFEFKSREDLYGETICKNLGFAINDEFDDAVETKKIKVIESEDMENNIKKLLYGNIHGLVGNYYTYKFKTKKKLNRRSNYFIKKNIVPSRPASLVLSKNSKINKNKNQLLRFINEILKEMYSDGTIDIINRKYIN